MPGQNNCFSGVKGIHLGHLVRSLGNEEGEVLEYLGFRDGRGGSVGKPDGHNLREDTTQEEAESDKLDLLGVPHLVPAKTSMIQIREAASDERGRGVFRFAKIYNVREMII